MNSNNNTFERVLNISLEPLITYSCQKEEREGGNEALLECFEEIHFSVIAKGYLDRGLPG